MHSDQLTPSAPLPFISADVMFHHRCFRLSQQRRSSRCSLAIPCVAGIPASRDNYQLDRRSESTRRSLPEAMLEYSPRLGWRIRRNLAEAWPSLAKNTADLGQQWANIGRQHGPSLAPNWPMWANIGSYRLTGCPHRPRVGQTGPNFAQIGRQAWGQISGTFEGIRRPAHKRIFRIAPGSDARLISEHVFRGRCSAAASNFRLHFED